jgi:hypothetical protein
MFSNSYSLEMMLQGDSLQEQSTEDAWKGTFQVFGKKPKVLSKQ